MPKLDGKLMHASLQALCKPDEKYYYPVYGNVGKVSKLSTSPMNKLVEVKSTSYLIKKRKVE